LDRALTAPRAPSPEEIASVLVIVLGESVKYQDRPKVDKGVWAKRLQIGALIGKAAAGGALATANMAIGAIAGLSVVPTAVAAIPISVGVVTSAYTGLVAACDAVEKIGASLRS
jgi:hypothetical protein